MNASSLIPEGHDALGVAPLDGEVLAALAAGRHHDPHAVLGQHPAAAKGVSDRVTVIRVIRPLAAKVAVCLPTGARIELMHAGHGIWQGVSVLGMQDYTVEARYDDGGLWASGDPYRFSPTIGELDLHLIGEGRHEELWRVLGARVIDHPGTDEASHGTAFTVWAPRAEAVRVVGDFNGWDGTSHAMRSMGASGVWELFVPGIDQGSYKFEVLTGSGRRIAKADPMARRAELPPATASLIVPTNDYAWADAPWMHDRAARQAHQEPMSVYELHLGSWRTGLGYRDAADALVDHVGALGFTHVEFLPLAEHPFGGSWGYQVTGYYAPTSRFGTPDDLRFLIDRLHRAGIGVIFDWVPAHFPKDDWALARFDGGPLYEHADPRRGEHRDWGTYVFDYGRAEVRNFLVANALYWLDEFHVDGLRVDAVASMLYLDYSRSDGQWEPNIHGGRENLEAIDFIKEVTATAYRRHPGTVIIAEESTSFPGVTSPTDAGGLGFGMKWNMGWMHDSLDYVSHDPLYRSYHHNDLTFSLTYAFSENFVLPISHDEVVHGKGSLMQKMPGDHSGKLANVRLYLAYMWSHPGKQLLFMGQEFGQSAEWSHERELDWWESDQPGNRGLLELVGALNRTYRATPALWQRDGDPHGFEWIEASDAEGNVIAYLRRGESGPPLVAVMNFSGVSRHDYRLGLPHVGRWKELLNTDATSFGGAGLGNLGSVVADDLPWMGRPASVTLTLPALGALWLQPE